MQENGDPNFDNLIDNGQPSTEDQIEFEYIQSKNMKQQ